MQNGNFFTGMKRMFEAYEALCKPYSQEMGISVQAFEILMYIAKSEGVATAQDICKRQNIKPTLMSFHIEKLVQAGYIERKEIDGNRRSIKLVCTEKAAPIVQKATEINAKFSALMWDGVGEEERKQLFETLKKISDNTEKIINGDF